MQADHEKTIEELKARISELEEVLSWYVDNDDTNEGDQPVEHLGGLTWDEVNAPWIGMLRRAEALLGRQQDDDR